MTDKETTWERRWREAQETNKKEEKDEKWIHLSEEQKADLRTEIKETEEDDFRERKRALLTELERQVEASGKSDVELKEIAELKNQLKDWKNILDNPRWNQILRTYFRIIYALKEGMCSKTILTVECKDGTINFVYTFFDKDNKEIATEFNKIEGEDD